MKQTRTTDPYRDTEVIDSRAPRFNQTVVGLVTVLALATGWWWLALGALVAALALLAAATGLCAGCEAYKLGCRLRGEPFVCCPLPARQA
jgi:hypothetical protein